MTVWNAVSSPCRYLTGSPVATRARAQRADEPELTTSAFRQAEPSRTRAPRRHSGGRLAALLGALSLFAVAPDADAQATFSFQERPTRMPAFGRSVATTDDSTALVQNPANLAFMPGPEFRWSLALLDDETAEVPWQGHALGFAFPFGFIPLATGLRVDLSDPSDTQLTNLSVDRNYQWLTWGLATRISKTAALGFSWQRSYSEAPALHGLASWSFGLSVRPSNYLGLAFVAADANSPSTPEGLSPSDGSAAINSSLLRSTLDRSYDVALAYRPLQHGGLEIGLEGKYVDTRDPFTGERGYWVPRATLGFDIPSLGRLRGDVSLLDFSLDKSFDMDASGYIASAALAIHFNTPGVSSELAVGSLFGNGLVSSGENPHHNLQGDLALSGFRQPAGIEAGSFALRVRIEQTPGTREHVALLRRLWSIAEHEPSVAAVVFELRASPSASLARTQELRDAIAYLRAHGKKVLCHIESGTGNSLYACAGADRILINPAGGIRVAGLATTHFYIANLLKKLGIRAEFVRIGAHKSAPEMFMKTGATDTARADKIDLLQQFERYFVGGVAAGRKLDVEALRQALARGPFIAKEAKTEGLVDGFAFDDQLEDQARKLAGSDKLELIDDERAPRASEYLANTRSVAIIYVDGDMVDGRSQTVPFAGMRLAGSYTIAESIKEARENPNVGAIVLRIETGGGSAMAADVIWRELSITVPRKPVIVSMGSAAASGGYYIAAPASRIFANPLTITGSIGIFYGKADVQELFRKIGVNVEVYKTAPRADAESIFRPFTDEERKELRRKVGQFYGTFLERVALGRKLTTKQVDAVGRGRVWTGAQALTHQLVDELGGLRQALAYARKVGDLPEHAPIIELPVPDTSIIGRLLGIEGLHSDPATLFPHQIREMARALHPFVVHPADVPLARSELVILDGE